MKRLPFLAALVGSLGALAAEGTVLYINKSTVPPGVDAPVWAAPWGWGTKLEGPGCSAELLWGNNMNSLSPVANTIVPFRTGTGAGYWNPGTPTRTIAGSIAGATVFLAVRAWDNGGTGLTFDQAVAAGKEHGMSDIFGYTLGGAGSPPSSPGAMGGLKSFYFGCGICPEPSTTALVVLGIAALLLRRRR